MVILLYLFCDCLCSVYLPLIAVYFSAVYDYNVSLSYPLNILYACLLLIYVSVNDVVSSIF